MREPGFYWVTHNEFKGWEIAHFDVNKNWWFTGWGSPFLEGDVVEIDERRLVFSETEYELWKNTKERVKNYIDISEK